MRGREKLGMCVSESPVKDRSTRVCVCVLRAGGVLIWLSLAFVPLSGISHGNSSRIPRQAGDGSVAPWRAGGGGVSSRTLRWFLCSAVVSATFSVSLHRHECAFLHMCCLRRLLALCLREAV